MKNCSLEKLEPFINSFLSNYVAAYREHYSTQHVLIRLAENSKKVLDQKFIAGMVQIDFSKNFDCIPHDLLIAKRYAYGFSQDSVTFIYSYLKRQKKKAKINNFLSEFLTLLLGVPQISILGPILFNIFLNATHCNHQKLTTLLMIVLYRKLPNKWIICYQV